MDASTIGVVWRAESTGVQGFDTYVLFTIIRKREIVVDVEVGLRRTRQGGGGTRKERPPSSRVEIAAALLVAARRERMVGSMYCIFGVLGTWERYLLC